MIQATTRNVELERGIDSRALFSCKEYGNHGDLVNLEGYELVLEVRTGADRLLPCVFSSTAAVEAINPANGEIAVSWQEASTVLESGSFHYSVIAKASGKIPTAVIRGNVSVR